MYRYRFVIEYVGTDFAGWQIQPGETTVQGALQAALRTCLRQEVLVMGAGRTDAGVHAAGQVAHFDSAAELDTEKILRSVNGLTPQSVCIRNLEQCSDSFHSRYSANWREYRYTISLRPVALNNEQVWTTLQPLDVERFRSELEQILGEHDFCDFSIPRHDGKSTLCNVYQVRVELQEHLMVVHLRANRFLHKMVRSLVGACYDVGRKYHPPGLIKTIFGQTFQGQRTWAPACGLCLVKVGYLDYEY